MSHRFGENHRDEYSVGSLRNQRRRITDRTTPSDYIVFFAIFTVLLKNKVADTKEDTLSYQPIFEKCPYSTHFLQAQRLVQYLRGLEQEITTSNDHVTAILKDV